jgi:phosphatidylserine/phosphatidylglycerophosphate/cardiolipin synthase-like enzyme
MGFLPGIWGHVDVDPATGRVTLRANLDLTLFPGSHHQKICIVDGQVGFCGGLDVNKGRMDTPAHKALWHDVHCQVEGLVAGDLQRSFGARWERERAAFNAFVTAARAAQPRLALRARPAPPMPPAPAARPVPGTAMAQLLRTISTDQWDARVPRNVRDDVELAYRQAIGQATGFVYIENQYIRDQRVAEWLVERAGQVPDLQVVVVLPVAPEEITFPPVDQVTMLGMHLQRETLLALRSGLGPRVGLFSMVEPAAAPRRPRSVVDPASRSRQVYVHSKCLIVDDQFAIIGSANANPRSFRVDTEACIGFFQPEVVTDLRLRLWGEILGHPSDLQTWAPTAFVTRWSLVATGNLAARPANRNGFVVPHDPLNPAVTGAPNALIPDAFAEAVDFDEERSSVVV